MTTTTTTTTRTTTAKETRTPPWYLNLAFAMTGSCFATACVHPFDTARVRAQVDPKKQSWVAVSVQAYERGGVAALYTGVSAGLLRQFFYGTTRFGAYQIFSDLIKRANNTSSLSMVDAVMASSAAGFIAGIVGNPADVALVRMAADARAPPHLRRGYRNGFDAMARALREEGLVRGWYSGVGPNVIRGLQVNTVMMTSYTMTKDSVSRATGLPDGLVLQFIAGNIAGFSTAALTTPIDVCKTQLQNARPEENVTRLWHAAQLVWAKGGVAGFWRGFMPFWLKLAPHTTLTMMVVDQARAWYLSSSSSS